MGQSLHVCYIVQLNWYMQGMETLTGYNIGTHTCSFIPPVAQNDELKTEAIQENTDLGP